MEIPVFANQVVQDQSQKADTFIGRWVAVSDWLPENGGALVHCYTGDIVIATCYDKKVEGWSIPHPAALQELGVLALKDSTHWMPLPEAPR